MDREQPVERVQTLDALLATSEAQRRFALLIFEKVFAAVGLLLAMAGIYGVLSVSVVERTREMGIRTALGATRRDLLRLVVRQGMLLAGVGALIGISASVLASPRARVHAVRGLAPRSADLFSGSRIVAHCVGVGMLGARMAGIEGGPGSQFHGAE